MKRDSRTSVTQRDPFQTPKKKSRWTPPSPADVLRNMSGFFNVQRCETPMRERFSEPVRENVLPTEEQKRDQILVVGMQHFLDTTLPLIQMLKYHGIKGSHIILRGIYYSTHQKTMEALKAEGVQVADTDPPKRLGEYQESFEKGCQETVENMLNVLRDEAKAGRKIFKIIFLDDGAGVISAAVNNEAFMNYVRAQGIYLYGVEQTSRGHDYLEEHSPGFPWISVAKCDLKQNIESGFIAESLIKAGRKILKTAQAPRCGIIGLGVIGGNLAQQLSQQGYQVSYFDTDTKKTASSEIRRCATLEELMQQNNYIFCCVGRDVLTQVNWVDCINEDKHLINCGSGDLPYRSLLRFYQLQLDAQGKQVDPLSDIIFEVKQSMVKIYQGGFPLDFKRGSPHAVSPKKIIPTRGMLLAGGYTWVIHNPLKDQLLIKSSSGRVELDNGIQQYIEEVWRETLGVSQQDEMDVSVEPRVLQFRL